MLVQSPEPDACDKVLITIIQIELEFGNVGFGKKRTTSQSKDKNQ